MSAIEITGETAKVLADQAKALGLSVDEYLKTLLGVAQHPQKPTTDEFIAALVSLAEDVEPIPRDFSREDVYFPER